LVLAVLLPVPGGGAAAGPGEKRPANRLARETSPYLLLHAHNPVDWYPWGPEAFAKAKAEDKPIFLSVGYSSCYWCHVMERECFDDPEIARALNAGFVCVKVDREERPDVDQVYMNALQAFGSGGWPMSMFLTPAGRPFFGGTYFPPKDRDGMPGFPSVLKQVAEAWRDHRAELERDANHLSESVRRSLAGSAVKRRVPLSRTLAAGCRSALADQFDPQYGGFGFNPQNARRPKFPEPVNLVFLLDQHRRDASDRSRTPAPGEPDPLAMVRETLDHMARGGIRDQLAGGYHRYAVSRYWIVPHFEKMLYDNAQLASAHLLAFEATGDPRWRREAEDTFAFVARTMTAPEGGFYSALDAETDGEEGQYYVWTRDQIKQVLGDGDDYDAFAQVYGLKREPNFEKGRYVLLEPRTRAQQAETLKTTPEALEARLAPLRAKLLAARDRRPAPLRDDKVLTSWNGLMIAAYAEGFRVLKEERYRRAAEKAADFLWSTLRTPGGRLLRTYRAGRAKLPAYLEDYAFLAHGLLRLHAATSDPKRLAQAKELTDRMIADFADPKEGGFFYTADDHESLLARPKDPYDGALPSGNSVAVRNLVALSALTDDAKYLDHAGKALEAFSTAMAQNPIGLPMMLTGLEEYLDARPDSKKEEPAGKGPAGSQDVVTAKAAPAKPSEAGPGREFDVTLTVTVKPGWHVYANPAVSEIMRPTTVTLAPLDGAKLVKVTYPAGELKKLSPGSDEPAAVYENEVKLAARVRLDKDVKADALTLKLQYQACNDRACLAPATLLVPVTW
jgi:uncharacterized protein YyaL (SSP411 family)